MTMPLRICRSRQFQKLTMERIVPVVVELQCVQNLGAQWEFPERANGHVVEHIPVKTVQQP